ncbi:MAG: PilX N-terminal domain-containing pilus assembly protein [Mariprofundaceae bacterium]|nr:PilX N-terminal domain-containing pilus assembly protein [Mariprofundaceae bacterium]
MYTLKQPSFIDNNNVAQAGFVLPTSLVLLALLTMLALSVYFGSLSTEKMSAAAQRTTQAYYYAETAANYMQWVLAEDAEMDSYANYSGGTTGSYLRNGAGVAPFAEPSGNFPAVYGNFSNVGDSTELSAYLFNPGPVVISDTAPNGVFGQVKYFDNSPLLGRAIKWPYAKTHLPVFEDIYTILPRYIVIEIDGYGNISPSIPKLPHGGGSPVVGNDIPKNGAIVWLTAGVNNGGVERDIQIIPLDAYSCTWGLTSTWTAADAKLGLCDSSLPNFPPNITGYPHVPTKPANVDYYPDGLSASAVPLPPYPISTTVCNVGDPYILSAQACDAYSGWLITNTTNYKVVIYALGYVNGKPMRLVRKTR